MKKKYALVIALLVLLACCSSAIAETSYSAGSVYHTFITTGYESKTYSSMYWRHVTCYAYSASGSGNSGIYYDGVRLSSNSQMFRPVDSMVTTWVMKKGYIQDHMSVHIAMKGSRAVECI